MRSLKYKIVVPFLTIMFVIMLVTIILFNIAMRFYAASVARTDLRKTAAAVEILIRQQVIEKAAAVNEEEDGDIDRTLLHLSLQSLVSSIRASKLLGNTEILMYNLKYELVFPQKQDDAVIVTGLAGSIAEKLPVSDAGVIYSFKLDGKRYYALNYYTDRIPEGRISYLVFATSNNRVLLLLRIVNLILIMIMMLSLAAGIIVSLRISGGITRPIIALGGYAKKIGGGSYESVPADNSSSEISGLYSDISEMSHKMKNYDNTWKTFLQNASHELKTPLMSIQGYAEGITGGIFPDVAGAAEIIRNESIKLNNLVEELLTLSRIENQNHRYELTEINLASCIAEYIQRARGIAVSKNRQLITDIPDTQVIVTANDDLLSRAFMNILENCIRYSETAVTVRLRQADTNIRQEAEAAITISDDGKGISKTDLPHIFERFYKGKGGNFGLGLSIAKIAVEYMGGRLEARNLEKGAEFIIILKIIGTGLVN